MKITQASVLGLLCGVSATASPRRPNMAMSGTGTKTNKWPLFTTIVDPVVGPTGTVKLSTAIVTQAAGSTAADATTGATSKILQKAYYGETAYGCYRQNQYFFPVQYITAGKITGTPAAAVGTAYVADAVGAQIDSGVRTFW